MKDSSQSPRASAPAVRPPWFRDKERRGTWICFPTLSPVLQRHLYRSPVRASASIPWSHLQSSKLCGFLFFSHCRQSYSMKSTFGLHLGLFGTTCGIIWCCVSLICLTLAISLLHLRKHLKVFECMSGELLGNTKNDFNHFLHILSI